MPRLSEVCRNVRSKVAGPFWITIDAFFDGAESYRAHHAKLRPAALAPLLQTEAAMIQVYPVEPLCMVKISYPRAAPQGGVVERDMHSGQQYVRLLDLELD